MKNTFFCFIFLFVALKGFSQGKDYVLIKEKIKGHEVKLKLNKTYNFTLKNDFVKNLNPLIAERHNEFGYYTAILSNADSNNFYFNDTIAIPFKEINDIEYGGFRYYFKEGILISCFAAFGIINYYTIYDQINVAPFLTLNTIFVLIPISTYLIVRKFNGTEKLRNYEIEKVVKRDIFNRREAILNE